MNDEPGDHHDSLLREAASRLVDAVRPYGVLTREKLAELSGAASWNSVDFEVALRWSVEQGYLRRLDAELYEAPRPTRTKARAWRSRAGGKRGRVGEGEGGWYARARAKHSRAFRRFKNNISPRV